MSSGVPWSVKGIDSKARETAKDLARRSGMTLGEWLTSMIEDHGDGEATSVVLAGSSERASVTEALERLSARIEAAESRSTLAISGIDQTVRGIVARLSETEREQTAVASRFEGGWQEVSEVQELITERLRQLEDDAAGPRSADAMKTLEGALGRVSGKLYESEGRTRAEIAQMRDEFVALSIRMKTVEASAESLQDSTGRRVAERIEAAEARTSAAVRGLEVSFAQLDRRLADAENRFTAGGALGMEQRFEQLASDLSAKVDETRNDLADQLRGVVETRLDRVDVMLSDMTQHVHDAERNSARAMERMGQEVLRVAEGLGRRVQGVEQRSAAAIEQVSGDVGRIAASIDSRLNRADNAQAQALEKLGGEIARITERLAERIGAAERRSAQAIDDVGEQVNRATERLNQRYDRSASDLAERISKSEERTARLLDEARERLNEGARKIEQAAAPPPPRTIYAEPAAFADPYAMPPFGPAYAAPDQTPPPAVYPQMAPFGQAVPAPGFAPADFRPVEPDAIDEPVEPDLGDAEIAAADGFGPAPQSEADFAEPQASGLAFEDEAPDIEPEPEPKTSMFGVAEPAPAARSPSTRDLIEQARAAARSASQEKDGRGRRARAEAAPAAAKVVKPDASIFPGLSFGAKRRKKNQALKSALMMTAAVACFGLVAMGYVVLRPEFSGERPDLVAENTDLSGGLVEPGLTASPRAAVMLNPQPIDPPTPGLPLAKTNAAGRLQAAPPAPAAAGAATPAQPSRSELEALYAEGVRRLEARDRTGVESLRKAANLGYAPAQFALGKAYEDGQGGLAKDLGEARRWTERAAQAGVPEAMHNLGHYYYNGEGGAKNTAVAVDWFRRAANLGYADSQYNLGVIYEQGAVVAKNEAEAYKWYLLASRGGKEDDRAEARASVLRVGERLSPDAKSSAERIAGGFNAQAANPSVQLATGAGVMAAQKALDRLGYYPGPQDGKLTPGVKTALQNYQRDQGLPATGNLDATTAQRLAPFARQ